MTRSKRGMAVISGFMLVSFLFVGGAISEAASKKTMVGLISFSTDSNAVVGMVTSANRGMEKIISYQIPPLTGSGPYTFQAPYSLAIITKEGSSQASSMGPRNGNGSMMDNRRGPGNMGETDDTDRGRMGNDTSRGSDTMMDDEDNDGHMGGGMTNMSWSFDTYITLANTSADSISVKATFYDNSGTTVLKETSFNLNPHQTIQKSAFEILGLR